MHAQGLGETVHCGRRTHGIAVAHGWGRRGHQIHKAGIVDFACGQHFARFPHDGARACALALEPAIEHGSHAQRDGGDIDRGRSHQQRGRCLVTADVEDNTVQRIAKQRLDQ